MNIYLISGLGADSSIWKNLNFGEDVQVHFLDWIAPQPDETMRSYAMRMGEGIDTTQPFYVVGLSFGGMLATEIAEALQPRKAILISSMASRNELPWHYKAVRVLGLNNLLPTGKPVMLANLLSPVFGVASADDRACFNELLKRSDPVFSKWAVKLILNWDRTEVPKNVVRIHGTRDMVLPLGGKTADYIVEGGSHFMVFNRAGEIGNILAKLIMN